MTEPFAALNAALADHYVIDRELGRGGMALVYLARDVKHERFVALKTLRPEIAMALGRERFLREIRLAARLQHPNILPVYDSGDAAGTLYYVMPFVEGESLRDRLEREPQLPLDDALQITREVADALSYAHDHDVVHRDIKPENIMLSGGHAIVADFGIARAVSAAGGDKLTETGLAIGTPAYMPPEQSAGTGKVDRRSDIYSLACVLYETLAGQPPFTGPTAQAIMARHSLDSVPRLKVVREAIPDDLEAVIERALEKVPADRYQTSGEFVKALMAASAGAVSRVTVGRRRTTPYLVRRRRQLAILLGAVVLFAGGWIIFAKNSKVTPTSAGLDPRRVAVLYFEDLSRDSSLGYLADGLTEALIEQLSQVRSLNVISRNGVSPYRRTELPRDSVARALGVGTLVEGNVEPVHDRVRVTVRLVDGASGADLLHRASFEQPTGNLLVIRDTLAVEVARVLRQRLGQEVRLREERAGTGNLAAWTVVQQAAKLYKDAEVLVRTDLRGAAALYDRGDSLLAQAETLDVRWLVPIVERGKLAYRRAQLERVAAEADPWLRTALGHAERVLAREARNPDALELRGVIRFRQSRLEPDPQQKERLLAQAEADLEAATVANSIQVGAWNVLSILRYDKRDLVGANLAARRAYEVDAYLAQADQVLARLYVTAYDLEQFQQAADWCEKGRARFPQNLALAECELVLMTTPARRPDPDRAWQLAREIPSLAPAPRRDFYRFKEQIVTAAVLARAGLADSATRVLERSRGDARIDEERELLGFQAWVYTTLGDRERALELLREYFVASPDHRRGFAKHVHWWWRPLQDDARFRALIAP